MIDQFFGFMVALMVVSGKPISLVILIGSVVTCVVPFLFKTDNDNSYFFGSVSIEKNCSFGLVKKCVYYLSENAHSWNWVYCKGVCLSLGVTYKTWVESGSIKIDYSRLFNWKKEGERKFFSINVVSKAIECWCLFVFSKFPVKSWTLIKLIFSSKKGFRKAQ